MPEALALYRGFPPKNEYVWSPFVTKLEFRLRHSKVPYTNHTGSTSEGPNGKIPYMDLSSATAKEDHRASRNLVADSTVIIDSLIDCGVLQDLNKYLSEEQKAADMGIRALLEERLYFLGMGERWLDNYYVHRDKILESKPWLVRYIVGNLIHRKIVQTLHLQGCGRFSKEQQKQFRHEIWDTLERMLSVRRKAAGRKSGPFWLLGGKEPTEADAVVFAFINSNQVCKSCPESTTFIEGLPTIVDYARRIHATYFPDYEM